MDNINNPFLGVLLLFALILHTNGVLVYPLNLLCGMGVKYLPQFYLRTVDWDDWTTMGDGGESAVEPVVVLSFHSRYRNYKTSGFQIPNFLRL
jgi:hypothetical protein